MSDIPQKSVLLVDDDKFLIDMYAMKFTQQGFNVQAALSVQEALNDLRGGFLPDAILFDLVMPENDGFSFISTVEREKLAPKAIKIALTNQSSDAEREKVIELGADKCVIKASVVPSEVVSIVEDALSSKKR
jgi:CheY-like chemotaxis protein